jgi:hypothetical protein
MQLLNYERSSNSISVVISKQIVALVSRQFVHNVGTLVFSSLLEGVPCFETIDVVPSIVSERLVGVLSFNVGLGLIESTLDEDFRIWGAKFHALCLGNDVVGSTQTITNVILESSNSH